MGAMRAFASALFVALVLGAAFGTIFWQLMAYERAMGNTTEYWIWVWEWIGFTILLTLVLCRQELRRAFRGKKPGRATVPPGAASNQDEVSD
jgi:hypothetical protein